MGIFGSLLNLAVDVVTLPINVIQDVGNVASGQRVDSTANKIKEIVDDIV